MPAVSEDFVASLAKALNTAQLPCVLWGHYLLNVHGVPSIIGVDLSLSTGTKVLTRLDSLEPCPDLKVCPASSLQRQTSLPAFHTHVKDSEVTVALYVQSETLWFLPPFDRSILSAEENKLSPSFVLASDQDVLPPWRPGRGSGFFKPRQYPVVVPRSHVLLEAYMLLYARDSGTRIGSFAMPMIGYIEEYVDDDGYLPIDLLSEPLKTLYRELRMGERSVREWTEQLKKALRTSGDRRIR